MGVLIKYLTISVSKKAVFILFLLFSLSLSAEPILDFMTGTSSIVDAQSIKIEGLTFDGKIYTATIKHNLDGTWSVSEVIAHQSHASDNNTDNPEGTFIGKSWESFDFDPSVIDIQPFASINNNQMFAIWFLKRAGVYTVDAGYLDISENDNWQLQQGLNTGELEPFATYYKAATAAVSVSNNGKAAAAWVALDDEYNRYIQFSRTNQSTTFGNVSVIVGPLEETDISKIDIATNTEGNSIITYTDSDNNIYAVVVNSSGEIVVNATKISEYDVVVGVDKKTDKLYVIAGENKKMGEFEHSLSIYQYFYENSSLVKNNIVSNFSNYDPLFNFDYSENESGLKILSFTAINDVDLGVLTTVIFNQGIWGEPKTALKDPSGNMFNPVVRMTNQDAIYLVTGFSGGDLSDIYITSYDGSTWRKPLTLSTWGYKHVDMEIDPSGNAMVIFEDLYKSMYKVVDTQLTIQKSGSVISHGYGNFRKHDLISNNLGDAFIVYISKDKGGYAALK